MSVQLPDILAFLMTPDGQRWADYIKLFIRYKRLISLIVKVGVDMVVGTDGIHAEVDVSQQDIGSEQVYETEPTITGNPWESLDTIDVQLGEGSARWAIDAGSTIDVKSFNCPCIMLMTYAHCDGCLADTKIQYNFDNIDIDVTKYVDNPIGYMIFAPSGTLRIIADGRSGSGTYEARWYAAKVDTTQIQPQSTMRVVVWEADSTGTSLVYIEQERPAVNLVPKLPTGVQAVGYLMIMPPPPSQSTA